MVFIGIEKKLKSYIDNS